MTIEKFRNHIDTLTTDELKKLDFIVAYFTDGYINNNTGEYEYIDEEDKEYFDFAMCIHCAIKEELGGRDNG